MTEKQSEKWYGKIIYDNEGIETYAECDTEAEAKSFVNGFNYAKELTKSNQQINEETDPLEEYWTAVDQVEPEDE